MYVGNLQKLKVVKDQITKYYMVDPFKIPVMVTSDTENPALRWADETTKRDILVHWSQVYLTEVIAYQRETNQYASGEYTTSSNWVKDQMMNSSKAELMQRFDKKSEKLELLKQGGITNLKFMLDKMFCITKDV